MVLEPVIMRFDVLVMPAALRGSL